MGSSMNDFEFTPPPEAPVFEPTDDEFRDPLAFISKIRPIAERAGICKIKPPPDWQPPFAVDVDSFKFTPRIQRLNELEAKTRIKLNFLDKIAKFWDLQGSSLKIPTIDRKAIDLHTLYMIVQREGGFDAVVQDRKWSRVAAELGYPSGRSLGSLLRGHYERILYPYQIFKSGARKIVKLRGEAVDSGKKDKDYIPHGIPSRQAIKPPQERYSRRSKRQTSFSPAGQDNSCDVQEQDEESEECVNYGSSSELKKLKFFGAGPKMPGYSTPTKNKDEQNVEDESMAVDEKVDTETLSSIVLANPIDQIVCHVCSRGDSEESMLLCDGCDGSYHTFCLLPPLNDIPKGDWRCPRCIAKECYKSHESFGFEQATKEYTLQSFGEMADQFKSDYFNMPVHMVPTSTVEKEFWRIVGAIDEDVTVQYGADLHTMEHGSGFPTKMSKNLMPGDEEYANSGWNLNVLPVLEGSVLGHINADISGMKIPWMYVGMCFATFCWHNEDHWSYSINYLHWGEPKTWYGVPGSKADLFEEAMKTAAPELFDAQPDLLHQLVTIMNPNILMKAGVPVYRTNQCAGEFVVTFPRAYHSGFNQGYNFAEAVNFCPSDWLVHGRNCIEHYSIHNRFCVFSHDELICKMASDPDSLDLHLAAATYQDMLRMVENEMKLRKSLMELGIVNAEREAFELLPDDERQCDKCKTTCFLSAVTCACTSKLVCIKHAASLCSCPLDVHCLRFRYTLDELPIMLHNLKSRAESFDIWSAKARKCLEAVPGSKMDLTDLKQLVREADDKRYPDSELLKSRLATSVQEAEKCATVAQQIVCKKVRTRNRQSLDTAKCTPRLTIDELILFLEAVDKLSCEIQESSALKDLLKDVSIFRNEAKLLINSSSPTCAALESILDVGISFDMDLPEIPILKQVSWLEEAMELLGDQNRVTAEALRRLIDSGANFSSYDDTLETTLSRLQDLLVDIERWEEKARICLSAKPHHVMSTLEAIVAEAESIPAYLPNTIALKDAMRKAKEWNTKMEFIQSVDNFPYLDVLEVLLSKGRMIPVKLDPLPAVEATVDAARAWRERTERVFLKKNASHTLTEILSPRTDIGKYPSSKYRKRKPKDNVQDEVKKEANLSYDFKPETHPDRSTFVNAFKISEQREIQDMRELRIRNLQKRVEDVGDSRYCVCRRGLHGMMVQCELCKDWFHATCVSMPKSLTARNKLEGQVSLAHSSRDLKFLCPMCLRSRRPRLETILSTLVALQKLNVRLPEGEALQCLTERAMGWQDRARHSLATDELASALGKLSVYSQQLVERAAREKTKKIITTELMKVAGNAQIQSQLMSAAGTTATSTSTLRPETTSTDEVVDSRSHYTNTIQVDVVVKQEIPSSDHATTSEDESKPDKVSLLTELEAAQAFSSSEHAYSSASRITHGQTPKKQPRKSPLVPRQLETPVLELSPMGKAQLEELMMEGDLLEVSLDETQHIWRILQACKPHREDYFPEFNEMENEGDSNNVREKLFTKRKLVDPSSVVGRKLKRIKTKLMVKKRFGIQSSSSDTKISKKINKESRLFKMKGGAQIACANDNLKKIVAIERKTQRWRLGHNKKAYSKDDELDDTCAAAKCRRPSGEVNWVQCDGGCDLWFHLICVGLTKSDVNESEDYICASCKAVRDVLKQEPQDDVEESLPLVDETIAEESTFILS